MSKPDTILSEYLSAIGRTGGKSGFGQKKTRGNTDYYADLGRRSAESRRLKKLELDAEEKRRAARKGRKSVSK